VPDILSGIEVVDGNENDLKSLVTCLKLLVANLQILSASHTLLGIPDCLLEITWSIILFWFTPKEPEKKFKNPQIPPALVPTKSPHFTLQFEIVFALIFLLLE